MEKIYTKAGIAREKVREDLMNKEDMVYQDTDSMDVSSSYPTGEGFHLSAVGPSFKMDLGKLSREDFWKIVDFICKMRGWYDGEDW